MGCFRGVVVVGGYKEAWLWVRVGGCGKVEVGVRLLGTGMRGDGGCGRFRNAFCYVPSMILVSILHQSGEWVSENGGFG